MVISWQSRFEASRAVLGLNFDVNHREPFVGGRRCARCEILDGAEFRDEVENVDDSRCEKGVF